MTTTETMTHEVVITGWRKDVHPQAASVNFMRYWKARHGEALPHSAVLARMKTVTPENPFQWEMVQSADYAAQIVLELTNNCGLECHAKEMTNGY